MKKLYKLFVVVLFAIQAMPAFSQDYMLKSEIAPAQSMDDSRFSVIATVMDNDTWCRITWPDPVGYYPELWYDDGEADDLFIYANAGSMNALKFTPYYENYMVTGGRIYVGDGNFPGPFLGTSFRVLVYDDDGEDGFPGTVLDSTEVIVDNYEWVEFEGLTVTITEGSFYLAMKQTAPSPNAAPIGVDTDNPTWFRSYSHFQGAPGWVLSPLQDFMIRAWIYAYNEPSREIDSFEVARFSGFEIDESPLLGYTTILDTITLSEYDDYDWEYLPWGLHAYGVKTHFTGGEWSDYDVSNIVTHLYYLNPPSCFYQADNLLLIACPPLDTNGILPSNLLGLNLYRDMEFVGYYSFVPEPPPFPIEIYISDLPPGIYMYNLNAVYDLTPYGFPGETGESGYLTTEAIVRWGYALPFLELWNYGTFETNNWTIDGPNWSINGNEGNPAPSAEFTWDPIQNDYLLSLESYPLLADSMTEGEIYLDYDIKLDNVNPTGNEELLVQVWNWDSQAWISVKTYSNLEGDFDWTSEHLNITAQAMGTVFKIRFLSQGENSLNILSWFVDNIHVYRACNPPENLDAYLDLDGMNLSWEKPAGTGFEEQWIHWDDGEISGNSIGSGIEWDVAARWTPDQLTDFEGALLKYIAFVPGEGVSTYKVRVWTGENGANLVVDQEVPSPVIGQWNYITLTTPVPLDITQELWVGYHINMDYGYPAGCDSGPAVDGYGNMLYFGKWWTLLEVNPELDYNWSIKAFIEPGVINDSVVTYAIYRSDDGDPYFLRDVWEQTYYLDDSVCDPVGFYMYKITAMYVNGNDTCESDYSNEDGDICEGLYDKGNENYVSIYPNPCNDLLKIESSESLQSICIYDSKGDKVIGRQGDGETRGQGEGDIMVIPVHALLPGLYLVKVETGGGITSRKVVIR